MNREIFEKAVTESKALTSRPDNNTLLQLYSLYKQATEGDAPKSGPENMFDFVGRAKYNAWDGLRGSSSDEAMQRYVDLVETLKK